MSSRMNKVMLRRGELLATIAMQREEAARMARRLQVPLAMADKGWAAVLHLAAHPLLVGAVAALLVARRKKLTAMIASGWKWWRLYKLFKVYSSKLAAQFRP
jgi:hypothetical protein